MQARTSSGMPAFTSHSFARTPSVSKPRSTFSRSKPYKSTIIAGIWTPVLLEEVLPGDTIKADASLFARLLSPLSVPIMDNLYMDWIVIGGSNRILWEHFVNQMGEQANPTDSIDYLTPKVTVPAGGFVQMTLADYFGLPIGVGGAGSAQPLTVCAYPFRMYNRFIKDWVIAQNIVDSPTINVGDGPDTLSDTLLFRRMKRPDYFTSSQPATQKGSPVELPIAGTALVEARTGVGGTGVPTFDTNPPTFGASALDVSSTTQGAFWDAVTAPAGVGPTNVVWSDPQLQVSGSSFSALTINEFRLLATTQQFLELDERGGTRFPEYIFNHWGVQSSDGRMQRIEFIAAGTIPIMTHIVPQTSATASTAQGNLAAFTSAAGRCNFSHSFEEHGWLMVLVEIRADLTYQNGLQRKFSRQTRYDYFDPLFANIGEQAVLNQEIFASGSATDSEPWGYQEYGAEYRFGFGEVTGLMRASATGNVSVYNLSINYSSLPALNTNFMEDDPPISRICAVEDQPYFIYDSFWNIEHTRVMPMFGVPGLTRI